MALLLVDLQHQIGDERQWREAFARHIPDLQIRTWPEVGEVADVEYLAFMRPDFDALPPFPGLKAMFSRSAGVEGFAGQARFPGHVPLGKIDPPGGDPMMTEYAVMHVLRLHREMPLYAQAQARRECLKTPIRRPEHRRVGFLGLGVMATAPAKILKSLGFPVSGWVRTPRAKGEFPLFVGEAGLPAFLGQTDIAVCLLPLTPQTEGILCTRTFAMMPKGAMVVNLGRGGHVVDADLIAALDSGQLAHAALDVTTPEPLPPSSPLWSHPKVTIMPHVARRPTIDQMVKEIAANVRSIRAGGGLLQRIDLAQGY
jgi:glyoxylate/hydroxypyruvate reductase A